MEVSKIVTGKSNSIVFIEFKEMKVAQPRESFGAANSGEAGSG